MKMNREIKEILFDEFENLKNEYEIIQYDKRSNGEWVENRRFESGRGHHVIDGQIYYVCGDSLIELNMDFNSKTCGACYAVGKRIDDKVKITGNEILFRECAKYGASLSLHKQSYSDGTCFYSLKDSRGKFSINHGSRDITELIRQIELEKQISIDGKATRGYENKAIQDIYDETIRFYDAVLDGLKHVA